MKRKIGEFIKEYSVRNTTDENIPVYSVTNENGFCTGYFSKDVSSKDRTTYKIVPRGCFAYNPSRINVGSVDWQNCEDRVIVSPLYVVFEVSDELDRQYLLHYLKSDVANAFIRANGAGSVRDNLRFNALSDIPIRFVPVEEQREIVKRIDNVSDLINKGETIIEKIDQLVKSRFVEMFGDPKSNPNGFETRELRDSCTVITGNTPSRAVDEYYGDYIEWIKTDNIVSGRTTPTIAAEFLSETGMRVGRTVDEGTILMACIAGSVASIGRVCITDRKVAFNQQINAIVPSRYGVRFLYVLLQISKEYLVEEINMALKGILSKSKLEDKVFYIPPMGLQKEFSIFVAQTDKSKHFDDLEVAA